MEQEYTVSIGMKIFFGAISAFMFAFAIFLFANFHSATGPEVLLIPFIILVGSALIILNQIKRRIVITADAVLSVNLFRRKEIPIVNIKGFRCDAKSLIIEPSAPEYPKIRLVNYSDFAHDEELTKWLRGNFEDLNAIDHQIDLDDILSNPALGATKEEREASLSKAKSVSIGYNIVGIVIAGILLLMFPNNYITNAIVLIYPFLGVFIVCSGKGLTAFVIRSNSPYCTVMGGMLVSTIITIVFTISKVEVVSYQNLATPFIILFCALVLPSLIFIFKSKASNLIAQVIFVTICSSVYGFGGIMQINSVYDQSALHTYKVKVLDKHSVIGKSTSYYLTIDQWGPVNNYRESAVDKSVYDGMAIGGTVKVTLKNGFLNIPWYHVAPY
jgi:hypothetical protein